MIFPFIPEDLFELNDNLNPQFKDNVIIIDDVFKNFEDITNLCYNTPVEPWKFAPSTRNFKDYYDCRLSIQNYFPLPNKINKRLYTLKSIISYFFNLETSPNFHKSLDFNYFKHKKLNIPTNYQFQPHTDDSSYNCIFYIDPYENGGTAIYEQSNIKDNEHINLFYDISNLTIKTLIPSKPNRCAIFQSNLLHGGYIQNHDVYYKDWRINLVNFLNK